MSPTDPVVAVSPGGFQGHSKWRRIAVALGSAGFPLGGAWAFIVRDPSPPPGGETPDDRILLETQDMRVTAPQLEDWLRRKLDLWEDEWPLEESDLRRQEVEDTFNNAQQCAPRDL